MRVGSVVAHEFDVGPVLGDPTLAHEGDLVATVKKLEASRGAHRFDTFYYHSLAFALKISRLWCTEALPDALSAQKIDGL